MRLSREDQFDPKHPPWLHCLSRCVRGAYLCGDGYEHRKDWIERRLQLLSRCCAVDIGAYAVMSNHLHVVLRPRPDAADHWSAAHIARAWWCMRYNVDPVEAAEGQVRDVDEQGLDEAAIAALSEDDVFIARWRGRLGTVSWFMKALKEPLSRAANKEDACSGTFWEGRFKSVPLLSVSAIVACMAYVDLNPIRAQLADVPESSAYTSIKTRITQRRARQRAAQQLSVGKQDSAAKTLRNADLAASPKKLTDQQRATMTNNEDIFTSWLTPVHVITSSHEGDPGYSLDSYIRIVDATGRLMRADKRGAIPSDLMEVLHRLDASWTPETWLYSMETSGSLGGAVLGHIASLAHEATRRGKQWMQHRCRLFAPRRLTS